MSSGGILFSGACFFIGVCLVLPELICMILHRNPPPTQKKIDLNHVSILLGSYVQRCVALRVALHSFHLFLHY